MGSQANYLKLGVFVVIASAMLATGLIVLSSGAFEGKQLRVETYFDESVQGLSVGSPVKRRGVQIGQVESITFVAQEYGKRNTAAAGSHMVNVTMSIDRADLPPMSAEDLRTHLAERARTGMRMKLASQGITGLCYIELDYVDPERCPPAKIGWEPKRLYVPSAPSTLATLTGSVDRILQAIERVDFAGITGELKKAVESLDKAVSDLKASSVSEEAVGLLKDLRQVSTLITGLLDKTQGAENPKVQVDIATVIKSANEIIQSAGREVDQLKLATVRKEITELVRELRQSNASVKALVEQARADLRTARVPGLIARIDQTLKRIDGLAAGRQSDVESIVTDLRKASENLRKLSESAKEYPSQLLFGAPPPRREEPGK